MLIKQQNTKINPYLIYTVNTIVLFNTNYYMSVVEYITVFILFVFY